LIVTGFTGSDGCATLTYDKDSWDGWGGPSPDISCTVEKEGFVSATPPQLNQHDQKTLAKLKDVVLNRDRSVEYGRDNGCGPKFTEWSGLNNFLGFTSNFGFQCKMHDKCYADCKIFLAMSTKYDSDSARFHAQLFCDYEMYENMLSNCNRNHGRWIRFDAFKCEAVADAFYAAIRVYGGDSYKRSHLICPNSNGEPDPSMKNDYTHHDCYLDGYTCGYNGSTGDDLDRCKSCCSKTTAVDTGGSYLA